MRRVAVLLIPLAVPAVAAGHGGAEPGLAAEELRHDWAGAWSVSWLQIGLIALALVLYARRALRLGGRLPAWRPVCFVAGLAVLLLASSSPIDAVGESGLFWVHMLQHMLIGDLAAALIVLGLTGPVLQPALQFRPVQRLRSLTHPMVGCAVWAVTLIAWHTPALYEASLSNEFVHWLGHTSFLMAGILMWIPLLEALPAPEWFGSGAKLGYVTAVRTVDALIANAFIWAGVAFYAPYEATAPLWGVTALQDQRYAGIVMLAWTAAVTITLTTILAVRLAREGRMHDALIARGLDPAAVRRAVRYGRADILAARHGIQPGSPPAAP